MKRACWQLGGLLFLSLMTWTCSDDTTPKPDLRIDAARDSRGSAEAAVDRARKDLPSVDGAGLTPKSCKDTSGGGGAHTPCKSTADCPNTPWAKVCNLTLATCEACDKDADCGASSVGPYCVLIQAGKLALCGKCKSDTDCTKGTGDTGQCRQDGQCTKCTTSQDCKNAGLGAYCPTAAGTCQQCGADADCIKGNQNTGKCRVGGTCTKCTADQDCKDAGLGVMCDLAQGACRQCTTSSDCVKAKGNTGLCSQDTHACDGCFAATDCQDIASGQCQ